MENEELMNPLLIPQVDPALVAVPGGPEVMAQPALPPLVQDNPIDAQAMGVQPLAAGAPVVDPMVAPAMDVGLVPEAVPMVNQKVGSESTSTTQTIQSKESKKALEDYAAAGQKAREAIAAEGAAKIEEDRKVSEKDKAEADALQTVYDAKQTAVQNAMNVIQSEIATRDALAAELANQKSETFWGSKAASDKIAASISVGLGAYAQALLGSGQNVGMVLLQRNMDEFSANQRQKYEAKVKQIESMNASIDDKAAMMGKLDQLFDAQQLAVKEKVRGQFAEALQMAKTAGTQATIQKRLADADMDIAKYKQDTAAKYEAKVTKNIEKDIVQKIAFNNSAAGIKVNEDAIKEYNKPLADLSAVRSELVSGLKILNDPNTSNEEKLQVAQGMLKVVNGSKESIGAEEAERLSSELRSSLSTIGKAGTYGAAAGAGAGVALAGVPTLGFGAPVGAAAGGVLGAIAGAGGAAFDEAAKPGGIKLAPDVPAFARRAQGTLTKVDGVISRLSKVQQLVKQGLTVPQANALIDSQGK